MTGTTSSFDRVALAPALGWSLMVALGCGTASPDEAAPDADPSGGALDAEVADADPDAGAPPGDASAVGDGGDAGADRDLGGGDAGEGSDLGGGDAGWDPPVEVRRILASETDPETDDVLGAHEVALGPPSARRGRLLLFFPGTTGTPQDYAALVRRAGARGGHAIGLAYENRRAVNQVCARSPDPDCPENMRREILFGEDTSELVEVAPANGAYHRIERLLALLEARHPTEGWDAFREAETIRWSRVAVAGHSQGAGHAAFTARLHEVERAVLFSGTEPARWTAADDFVTRPERLFGFVHRLEPVRNAVVRSWRNIGIPGMPISVDGVRPPYPSQQLETAYRDCPGDPTSNGYYHNCHVADAWMPYRADGTPWFAEVWDHLFEAPVP